MCQWLAAAETDIMPSSVESSPTRRDPATANTTTASTTTKTASASASLEQHLTPIPLIYDSLTFDARHEKWIKDLERKVRVP